MKARHILLAAAALFGGMCTLGLWLDQQAITTETRTGNPSHAVAGATPVPGTTSNISAPSAGNTLDAGIATAVPRTPHDPMNDVGPNKVHLGVRPGNTGYDTLPPGVYYQNRVVVVTFHDISPSFRSRYTITPEQFEADLDAMEHAHLNVITNRQFIAFLQHRAHIPDNAVLLTFDDGYTDMYQYALPILRAHHMEGTFFVIVGKADQPANHTENLGYMTWAQLEAMHRAGMEIQSHTYNSHYVVNVNGHLVAAFNTPIPVNGRVETHQEYLARIQGDFLKAREELEQHLGAPCTQLAWPYGWGTLTATHTALSAGYRYLYTTTPGPVTPWTAPDAIPRIDIGYDTTTPAEAVKDILDTARG